MMVGWWVDGDCESRSILLYIATSSAFHGGSIIIGNNNH
jgi:hypothetical protein